MGDGFGDGVENERPLHDVTVADFSLAETEVTVVQFSRFASETGYRTSAESPLNRVVRDSLEARASDSSLTAEARNAIFDEVLRHGGCGRWDPDRRAFDWADSLDWESPGYRQAADFPVVCLSWDDAAEYANWASRRDGLPEAYDVARGVLLDAAGQPTIDISRVRGYRLPTEAEWEFAARERGAAVRFGNGRNVADPAQAAFDASGNDYPYQIRGPVRRSPTAVRRFAPNRLGLYDMAGNAWEWVSDYMARYSAGPELNPYRATGTRRVIRGGRWGGDASELRAAKRFSWQSRNRCNASGFRLARSA